MKSLFRVLVVMLVAVLVACGGGGGGSASLTYVGDTTQASITDTNAEELAALAYYGSEVEVPLDFAQLQAVGQGSRSAAPVMQNLTELIFSLPEKVQLGALNANTVRTVESISVPQAPCDVSGTMSLSGTWNDATGVVQANISFANCTQYDGTILNGSLGLTASGAIGEPNLAALNLSLTLNLLSIDSPEDGKVVIDGTGSVSFDSQSSDMALLLNVVLNDVSAGKMAKLVDYRVAVVEFADYDQVSISGRVYGSDFGYVDLTTDPLILIDDYDNPYQGVYHLDGADGTWAEVDFSILSGPQGSYGDETGILGTFSI